MKENTEVKAPKPKGLGLCFIAVCGSEETSYIYSTCREFAIKSF